jgi:hypothetical protein
MTGTWLAGIAPGQEFRDLAPFETASRRGPGQNRTVDTAIFSRVLYQLSYPGRPYRC